MVAGWVLQMYCEVECAQSCSTDKLIPVVYFLGVKKKFVYVLHVFVMGQFWQFGICAE